MAQSRRITKEFELHGRPATPSAHGITIQRITRADGSVTLQKTAPQRQ